MLAIVVVVVLKTSGRMVFPGIMKAQLTMRTWIGIRRNRVPDDSVEIAVGAGGMWERE
jgi:hypothetical protein